MSHQPLFGTSFRTCHSPWVTLRARPAPRLRSWSPHQARTRVFFSDVTQFDLTDFAGQKPVAGKTGHCFVVGERHQLRALHVGLARLCRAGSPKAVVPPQDNWIFFSQLSPHRTTGNCFSRLSAWTTTSTFFLLGRIHLGAGSAGLLCRAGGAAGGFSSRVRRSATGVSRWPWPGNLKCTIWSYTAAEQSTCEFEGAHRLSSFSKPRPL